MWVRVRTGWQVCRVETDGEEIVSGKLGVLFFLHLYGCVNTRSMNYKTKGSNCPPPLPSYQHVTSLGELLCLLTPAGFTWTDMSDAYIEEAMTRNVLWLLKKHPELDTDKPDPK